MHSNTRRIESTSKFLGIYGVIVFIGFGIALGAFFKADASTNQQLWSQSEKQTHLAKALLILTELQAQEDSGKPTQQICDDLHQEILRDFPELKEKPNGRNPNPTVN